LDKNLPISVLEDLGKEAKIIITTHHKPDADAMGSSLGLKNFLLKLGYNPIVITPTDYAPFLHWMKGDEDVIEYEGAEAKADELILDADVVFCLDFNDLKRINEMGLVVERSNAIKVMVDHHRLPVGFDDYRYWTIDTSSTAELIYDLIHDWGKAEAIDKDIASCLYAGISSDTGGFKHGNTSSSTHLAVAELIQKGADNTDITDKLLDNFSENRTRLIGYSIYEKLEIFPEYRTALITLTREELERFKVKTGDTEGLVNYGLSIEGVIFAALIIDRTVMVKMSLRSKGDFPCNEVAAQYFGGGGHRNASGGASKDTLEGTINTFKKALVEYKDKLWAED